MKVAFHFEVQGSDIAALMSNAHVGIRSLLAPKQVLEDDVTWWMDSIVDDLRMRNNSYSTIIGWRATVHGEIRLPNPPAYDEALGG